MDGVDGALRFLQRQFASVAHEEAQWQEERQRLQQQVRELEAQRSAQEDAYKDALLRVKMLEFALRQERGRYLVSPAPVSSVSTSAPSIATASRAEHAPITRPAAASVTISRTMSGASHTPPASPLAAKALDKQVYRVDSGVGSGGNGGGKATPATPKTATKGTEISRPRMGSRNASSSVSDAPNSNERAWESSWGVEDRKNGSCAHAGVDECVAAGKQERRRRRASSRRRSCSVPRRRSVHTNSKSNSRGTW